KQANKILLLTEGYTGNLRTDLYEKVKANKIQVYCGLFGSSTKRDMDNITKYEASFGPIKNTPTLANDLPKFGGPKAQA
ncbi:MAG: hypothetical protein J6X92_03275, partial [Bacteroidales bacterium]|nr:hypothetical protein [Bacteroidales bacterium]